MRQKLSIVGAGNVGAAAAHWAASQQLADVVLVDIAPLEGKTKGTALDLMEATPVLGLAKVQLNLSPISRVRQRACIQTRRLPRPAFPHQAHAW